MSDGTSKGPRADFDRRDFVGALGMGGIGSLLLAGAAGAAGPTGDLGRKLAAARSVAAPGSGLTPQKVLDTLGVDSSNIAAVRGLVASTISADQLKSMADLLKATREAMKDRDTMAGPPPEALALQSKMDAWLPTLGDKVLELTGGRATAALSDPDRDPIDWWSLVHFLSGVALGALCFDYWEALAILIFWEIIEPYIWPGWNESEINQIMDVIIGMLGWYLAHRLKEAILGPQDGDHAPALSPARAG